MKSVVIVLSYLFSGLQALTSVLVFPLTILCMLGLLVFTLKIARDMKNQKANSGMPLPADRLGA